ncbi:MAG TPA: hypothetical protein VHF25_06325 [Nitriliruptorales bacterium]|nr:hypothetical protein [Nitriliruptorales bacterium]
MTRRAWLVRPNVRGRSRVDRWLAEGECAIGWREVGPVEPGTPRAVLRARLAAAYPGRSAASIAAWVGNLDRFINRMRVGDLVATPAGPCIHVGVVASAVRWRPHHDEAHHRAVVWDRADAPLERAELSDRALGKLFTVLTVTDVTDVLEELAG